MSGKGEKRRVDCECCVFKEVWGLNYFILFIESGNKVLCFIWNGTITVLKKKYNIRRHYETRYLSDYSQFVGTRYLSDYSQFVEKLRWDKLAFMKSSLLSQKLIFKKKKTENEEMKSHEVWVVLSCIWRICRVSVTS